jgi:hypothetical protein
MSDEPDLPGWANVLGIVVGCAGGAVAITTAGPETSLARLWYAFLGTGVAYGLTITTLLVVWGGEPA